jgi:hypothetical protein
MNVFKIMIAAFSATNIMTTFSYIISLSYNRLFKEPVMLNFILDNMGITLKGKWKKAGGWLAHYIIGFFFALIYETLWRYTGIKFGWLSGIAFGIASGVVGIIGWHIIYRLPDEKPVAHLREYYLQLFFAHIIFACAVVIAFKIFDYDPLSHL